MNSRRLTPTFTHFFPARRAGRATREGQRPGGRVTPMISLVRLDNTTQQPSRPRAFLAVSFGVDRRGIASAPDSQWTHEKGVLSGKRSLSPAISDMEE